VDAIVCTTCGSTFKPPDRGPARCPHCFTPADTGAALPEVLPADGWYYQVMGHEVGPVPFLELQQLARDGRISPETPVRRASGTRWLLAERVSGLAAVPEDRAEWYFTEGDVQRGPISYATLRKLIRAGQLGPDDHLWQASWPAPISVSRCLAENLLQLPASELPAVPVKVLFTCPDCGDRYAVDGNLAGKKVLCRTCNAPARVPARQG
jgi:hypothetical protein